MNGFDFSRRPDHNPDLTDEERAAIAAYPEARVRRIPTGVTGEVEERGNWRARQLARLQRRRAMKKGRKG
jgi:hypothetical protein